MVLLHLVAQFEILRAVEIHELDLGPDHEELADFFFERHVAESGVSPESAAGIVGGGSGGQGWGGEREKDEENQPYVAHDGNHNTWSEGRGFKVERFQG